MDINHFYDILEIGAEATESEIKLAYRDLINVWHPDRFSGNPRLREKAEEKLREYNLAYEKVLAHLSSEDPPEAERVISGKRIISISSGKGGVGKTNFTMNTAISMHLLKERVMILDADLGMANIDVLCGLTPRYNMGDVISRRKSLEDVIIKTYGGIKIIPGVSGVEDLTSLDSEQRDFFFEALSEYEDVDDTDIVLIDIGAGMGKTVIDFMRACNENIIITTPEPPSLMDAYALIKTIIRKKPDADVSIVVNMAKSREEGYRVYRSINRIANKFLNTELKYIGHIVFDKSVPMAVKMQKPYFLSFPRSRVSVCIREITLRMLNRENGTPKESGIRQFFKRISSLLSDQRNDIE